jgi:hypothetical protein
VNLTTSVYLHLAGGAGFQQQEPGASLEDEDPGTLLTDFFDSNPWLTAMMAGVGVVLVVWTILRTIWISRDDGNRKAISAALKGGVLALLLFSPSLVVRIAVLASDGVREVAGWFFDTVASLSG